MNAKLNFLLFLMIVTGMILISGCAEEQQLTTTLPKNNLIVTANDTIIPSEPPVVPQPEPEPVKPAEIFDVKISSLDCKWTQKTGDYNVKSDCVRIISNGTAIGPVGARLELPILSWSNDKFDCGAWTQKTGALIAVGHTCTREEGQPEKTTWTVDTEGDECPLKDYFSESITHRVKIYKDNELEPKSENKNTVVCQ